MAVCKACNLSIEEQETVKCSGICGSEFHAKIKCARIRSDLAKQIKKSSSPYIKYVCEDCKEIKIIHVLKAVQICNDNVKALDNKLDDFTNICNRNFRRVSILENTLNDVNIDQNVTNMTSDQGYDELKKTIDDVGIDLQLKLTNFQTKILSEVTKQAKQRPISCMNGEKLIELNGMLNQVDERISSIEDLLTNLSKFSTSQPNPDPRPDEKSLYYELIDSEAMSYDANPLMCQINSESFPPLVYLPSETTMIPEEEDANRSIVTPPELQDANVSIVSIVSNEDFDSDLDQDSEWVYVANRSPDISAGTVIQWLQRKFGLMNVKLDVLSQSSSTYRSFKVLINKTKIRTVLDMKNWPNDFYVRRFKTSKEKVFQETPHKKTKKKHFINNPRNQHTGSTTTM